MGFFFTFGPLAKLGYAIANKRPLRSCWSRYCRMSTTLLVTWLISVTYIDGLHYAHRSLIYDLYDIAVQFGGYICFCHLNGSNVFGMRLR